MIFGVQIKKVMWGNLLLMIFFTFLTFFSAYFNKVTDCGCFGDFMKLDPWNSFFKDIHLLFVSVVLFVFQAEKSYSRIFFCLLLLAAGVIIFWDTLGPLLNIYRLYNLCDISCCVINHSLDKRYHETLLSSHDNRMIPCISSE